MLVKPFFFHFNVILSTESVSFEVSTEASEFFFRGKYILLQLYAKDWLIGYSDKTRVSFFPRRCPLVTWSAVRTTRKLWNVGSESREATESFSPEHHLGRKNDLIWQVTQNEKKFSEWELLTSLSQSTSTKCIWTLRQLHFKTKYCPQGFSSLENFSTHKVRQFCYEIFRSVASSFRRLKQSSLIQLETREDLNMDQERTVLQSNNGVNHCSLIVIGYSRLDFSVIATGPHPPPDLEIIAQPCCTARIRYRSEFNKTKHRRGALQSENNPNYNAPTIRVWSSTWKISSFHRFLDFTGVSGSLAGILHPCLSGHSPSREEQCSLHPSVWTGGYRCAGIQRST